ncbi:macrophage mannose receptor 1-like isoform X1 [Acipenser ruthenus]|uniref:macrophage mannose receptor 1-like isoform X1 n=1 Tax=Acipenser ruthenus TaxID=7906 RepID=UPI002740EB4A|nr:macrophage mannose receptor 1-like isoform X1 [Acipenser ruthenus]XP_058866892.1 macrophage mannose receptor 1-like isoform X1 [Acipenser ruthenus]XP_058866893.1 macrophage mannose receptor 1-like isoform X1 [Acipenser ruthenus]
MGERELLIFLLAGLCVPASNDIRRLFFVNFELTWSEAQSYCRENHTDLVTVQSQNETEHLLNMTRYSVNDAVWIGLYCDSVISNWASLLYCASINSQGEWEDQFCYQKKAFMCYTETSNITERYTLIEELKTWTEAQQYCREHHTDLVSIKSASENEDLVKKAQGKPFWIGLFNNLWKWSHQGDNYTFHNWRYDQPDDYQDKEKCVVMLKDGKWADIDCKSHRSFICFDDTGSFLIYSPYQNTCVNALNSSSVVNSPCNPDVKSQQFRWVSEYRLQSVSLKLCLGVASKTDGVKVLLYPCDEKNELQQWQCRDNHVLAIQGADLFFNSRHLVENYIVLYIGSGFYSRWNIYGTGDDLCSRLSKNYDPQDTTTVQSDSQSSPTTWPSWLPGTSPAGTGTPVPEELHLISDSMVWPEAWQYCRDHYTDLVSLTSLAAQNRVSELVRNSTASRFWIGLHRTVVYDKWYWVAGKDKRAPLNYTNWAPGEPNNPYYEHCGEMVLGEDGGAEWNDLCCYEKLPFICFKDKNLS